MFDGRTLGNRFSGIAVYTKQLVTAMLSQLNSNEELLLILNDSSHFQKSHPHLTKEITNIGPFSFHRRNQLSHLIYSHKINLYHSPYLTLTIQAKIPSITTIYDLIPLKFPYYYSYKTRWLYPYILNRAIRDSDCLITLSNEVARQLTQKFPQANIVNCYPGPGEWEETPVLKEEKTPFFLYVGSWRSHKNLIELFQAFAAMQNQNFKLIMVGLSLRDQEKAKLTIKKNQWTAERFQFITHKLSADELNQLYNHCNGVVLPSIDEGFGFPAIEAAYHRLPLICSNIPVFHETVGDFPFYYSLGKSDELSRLLDNIADDKFSTGGTPKLPHHYSWKVCAEQTLRLYRSLVD